MDLLDQYIYNNTLSLERVLEEVDEWTLYVYYLGIEGLTTRRTYKSPIKIKDDHPSFSIYESSHSKTVEYMWKDSALGESGDILKLLIKTHQGINTREDALKLIAKDFEIGKFGEVTAKRYDFDRPNKEGSRIRIKAKRTFSKEGLDFWKSFHVDEDLLKWKQVREIELVWFSDEQENPYTCKKLTFAYPEYNTKSKEWCYQTYSPYEEKQYKFRNDLDENQIYGWNHLPKEGELLIITKSNKDILVLKKLGYISVSPRSETTMIKPKTVVKLQQRFKKVVTLFDNDEPGINGAEKYDLEHIYIPIKSGCKDVSDYIKMYGERKTSNLMKKLLC